MTDFPETVTLRRGALECVLGPACGGSIVRFSLDRGGRLVHLMRPGSGAALERCDPLALASFPLVPFSNRIAWGRFAFEGRPVEMPANTPISPHPIHGQGWLAPWTVEAAEEARAVLAYRHAADSWPFPYRAVQRFELEEDGLSTTLELTNEGTGPMPAGIGVHPYFPKPLGTRFTAGVREVWLNDPDMLPRRRVPVPVAWDFARGQAMDEVVIDNGFPGWSGRAEIAWPTERLRLAIEADPRFGHLVVFAPPGGDHFCAEPVSHMTDAVNRSGPDGEPDHGLAVLGPGETLSGSVRFRIAPMAEEP